MKISTAFIASVLTAFLAVFALAGTANAAGETATADFDITPLKGSLYEGGPVSANWEVSAHIRKPWADGDKILPLTKVGFEIPSDMTFHPNNARTPVCPDNKVGAGADMTQPPPAVLARCPNSVIGNGTANLYLAKQNLPVVPPVGGAPQWIDDVALIAYNGGFKNGRPYIKLHGYSYKTNYGVFIPAVLSEDGKHLDVNVPWLSQNSAVGDFALDIPGKNFQFTNNIDQNVMIPGGMDPNYLRAKCSSGSWTMGTDFTMQQRDNGTQEPYGEFLEISAPDVVQSCVGKPGKPGGKGKLKKLQLKAPKKVKQGKKFTVRIKVKNVGTANLTNVRLCLKTQQRFIRGTGKRCRTMSNLAVGKTKAVKIAIRSKRFRGNKKTKLTAVVSKFGKVLRKNKRVTLLKQKKRRRK